MGNFGSNNITINTPLTKEEKINFFQDQINASYIAPSRNKHSFSVLPYDGDNTFYYMPNYSYNEDAAESYEQVIIKVVSHIYWEDM